MRMKYKTKLEPPKFMENFLRKFLKHDRKINLGMMKIHLNISDEE